MRKLFWTLVAALAVTGKTYANGEDSLLIGSWNLFKIIENRTGDEVLPELPNEKFAFTISFEDSIVRYNHEVNKCVNSYKLIGPNMIKFIYYDECTKICCDKEFSDLLTYEECTGYFIKENTLVLVSEDRIFYFTRTK